jgi:hypothetical protein
MGIELLLPELHPALEVDPAWITPAAGVKRRLNEGAPVVVRIQAGKGKAVAYSVRQLVAEPGQPYELVNTSNGKVYVVSRDCVSCNCGDATYRFREDGCCKHRKSLRELLGVAEEFQGA